jgi:hypothetical protein
MSYITEPDLMFVDGTAYETQLLQIMIQMMTLQNQDYIHCSQAANICILSHIKKMKIKNNT